MSVVTVEHLRHGGLLATKLSIKVADPGGKYDKERALRVLLNCGWSLDFDEEKLEVEDVDVVLITDGDFAHAGALLWLTARFLRERPEEPYPKVLCTEGTYKFIRAALIDVLENVTFTGNFEHYGFEDLELFNKNCVKLRYRETYCHVKKFDDLEMKTSFCAVNNGYSVGGALWTVSAGFNTIVCGDKIRVYPSTLLNGTNMNDIARPELLVLSHEEPERAGHASSPQGVDLCNDLESLVDKLVSTLTNGGNVLFPMEVDHTLINLLIHLNMVWATSHLSQFKIVLASPIADKLLLLIGTCLEYMKTSIFHNFIKTLWNPLMDLSHVDIITSLDQLGKYRFSPTVFIATSSNVNWGFSNFLFVAIASFHKNLVILTGDNPSVTRYIHNAGAHDTHLPHYRLQINLRYSKHEPGGGRGARQGRGRRRLLPEVRRAQVPERRRAQSAGKRGPGRGRRRAERARLRHALHGPAGGPKQPVRVRERAQVRGGAGGGGRGRRAQRRGHAGRRLLQEVHRRPQGPPVRHRDRGGAGAAAEGRPADQALPVRGQGAGLPLDLLLKPADAAANGGAAAQDAAEVGGAHAQERRARADRGRRLEHRGVPGQAAALQIPLVLRARRQDQGRAGRARARGERGAEAGEPRGRAQRQAARRGQKLLQQEAAGGRQGARRQRNRGRDELDQGLEARQQPRTDLPNRGKAGQRRGRARGRRGPHKLPHLLDRGGARRREARVRARRARGGGRPRQDGRRLDAARRRREHGQLRAVRRRVPPERNQPRGRRGRDQREGEGLEDGRREQGVAARGHARPGLLPGPQTAHQTPQQNRAHVLGPAGVGWARSGPAAAPPGRAPQHGPDPVIPYTFTVFYTVSMRNNA